MSQSSYAMQKKIAKLTKIICTQNINNDMCKESLLELRTKVYEEELKHREEITKLQSQYEEEASRRGDIVKLEERERFQNEVKTLKESLQREHEQIIESLRQDHEAVISLSSKECLSLSKHLSKVCEQFEVSEQEYGLRVKTLQQKHTKDLELIEQKHRLEMDALKQRHNKDMNVIEQSKSATIGAMKSKHLKEVQEQKSLFKNDKMSEIRLLENRWISRLDKMELDVKKKYEMIQTELKKENEDLKCHQISANVKVGEMKDQLQQKDHIISNLGFALEEEKRCVEMAQKQIEEESSKFSIRESTLSDSIHQLQSEVDELSKIPKLLARAEKDRDEYKSKLTNANNELQTLMHKITELKANFDRINKHLRCQFDEINNSLLEVKTAQHLMKSDTQDFLQNGLILLKTMASSYEEHVINFIALSQNNAIKSLMQVNEVEKKKKNERILKLEKEIHECLNELVTKQNDFESRKRKLVDEIENLQASLRRCEEDLKIMEQRVDSLKKQNISNDLKHKQQVKEWKEERSMLNDTHSLVKSELVSCRDQLQAACNALTVMKHENEMQKDKHESNLRSLQEAFEEKIQDKDRVIKSTKAENKKKFETLIGNHENQIEALHKQYHTEIDNKKKETDHIINKLKVHCEIDIAKEKEQHQHEMIQKRDELNNLKDLMKNKMHNLRTQEDLIKSSLKQKIEECEHCNKTIMYNQSQISYLCKDIERINDDHKKKLKENSILTNNLLSEKEKLVTKNNEITRKLKELHKALEESCVERIEVEKQMTLHKNSMLEELDKRETDHQRTLGQLSRYQEARLLKDYLLMKMKEKLNEMYTELDEISQRKNNEIVRINLDHMNEKKIMREKFDAKHFGLESKLKLISHDLEFAEHQYLRRDSRPEDVFKIESLKTELNNSLEREKQIKSDMAYYKNELKNREDNYNSIFSRGSIEQNSKKSSLSSKSRPPTRRTLLKKEKENRRPIRKSTSRLK